MMGPLLHRTGWLTKSLRGLLIASFIFFAWLMVLITLQYIPARNDIAFLRIKQDVTGLWYYRVSFFAHVYSSIFVLLLGFVQFWAGIRRAYPAVHRWVGRFYTGLILVIAGPSGLLMGYYGNGGWVAQVAFCMLAVLWIWFTYQGIITIRKGNLAAHKRWMYRSYALTLSAISLRLWKWGIVWVFAPRPMDAYCIVAWLGWAGNLLVAEILIAIYLKRSTGAAAL